MFNQKVKNELSLEQLGEVSGGRSFKKSISRQNHQFALPIDAEFGFKIPLGKCGLAEIIGPDGECIPAPEL